MAIASLILAPRAHAAGAGPRTEPVRIVQVTVQDHAALDALTAAGFDISSVQGAVVTIYATAGEVQRLQRMGYAPIEVLRPKWTPATGAAAKQLGVYHTYQTMTSLLQAYAAAYGPAQTQHADLCRLTSLGQSVEGRELWALLISRNPAIEEDEPECKYVGAIHGDESLGAELCLYLIDLLLTTYATDARVRNLVDSTSITIVPCMNPDGLVHDSRYNVNGYDLNRSFPLYPENFEGTIYSGEPLHTAGRQPEVSHVMSWIAANSFVLSANFHTGALVVNYPYDDDGLPSGQDAPTPDDALFRDLSLRYASANPPMSNSLVFEDGITNGTAWYVVRGGMQDWNYRYVGCDEVTIELSNVSQPAQSQIATYWANNQESMLAYLEAVHMGVRGLVTDAGSGAPVYAKVVAEGNTQPVFTDPDIGDYHRLLLPGTYIVTISAPGYVRATLTGVTVTDGAPTRRDVALVPLDYDADINGDGEVNALDVQLIVNAALGLVTGYTTDLDGSGRTDAVDIQLVLNAAVL